MSKCACWRKVWCAWDRQPAAAARRFAPKATCRVPGALAPPAAFVIMGQRHCPRSLPSSIATTKRKLNRSCKPSLTRWERFIDIACRRPCCGGKGSKKDDVTDLREWTRIISAESQLIRVNPWLEGDENGTPHHDRSHYPP